MKTSSSAVASTLAALALPLVMLAGCEGETSSPTAPTASAVVSASATPPPPTAALNSFTIEKSSSKVDFMMEAPQEKIHGRANGTSEGSLQVDLMDVSKTTGVIAVDIGGLEIYQSVVDDKGQAGGEQKNDLQNTHARTWLEISADTPEDVRKANSRVEFTITKIGDVAPSADLTKLTGSPRKVTFTVTGDLLLHGKKVPRSANVEAAFDWPLDRPVQFTLRTLKPFAVDLAEHDVRPRDAFGKLAQKTLELLSPKVAKEALVSLDLVGLVAFSFNAPPPAPATDAPKK